MKTIEEAAMEYDNSISYEGKISRAAFISGAKFVQQWISVEEDLPPVGKLVQIKLTTLINDIVRYDHDSIIELGNGIKMFNCEQYEVKVTHWRPINRE